MQTTAGGMSYQSAEVSISSSLEDGRGGKNEPYRPRKSAEEVVLLDDLAFCVGRRSFALSDLDLRFVEALQAVLKSGQADISIKTIGGAVSDELEWA